MSRMTRAQRVRCLQRRLDWLRQVDADDTRINSFRRQEMNALAWAIPELEKLIVDTEDEGDDET